MAPRCETARSWSPRSTRALIRTGVIGGLQQLPSSAISMPTRIRQPSPAGRSGDLGHVGFVDFGMMDRSATATAHAHRCCGASDQTATSRLWRRIFRRWASQPTADLTLIVPALEDVLGGSLGDSVGSFNFKAITDRFSELMFDYPFRVPARFALIIRGWSVRRGWHCVWIRISGSSLWPIPTWHGVSSGDTREMRDKLLE